jgi:hypothetical protein
MTNTRSKSMLLVHGQRLFTRPPSAYCRLKVPPAGTSGSFSICLSASAFAAATQGLDELTLGVSVEPTVYLQRLTRRLLRISIRAVGAAVDSLPVSTALYRRNQ